MEIDKEEMFDRLRTRFLDSFNKLYINSHSYWFNKIKDRVSYDIIHSYVNEILVPISIKANIDKFSSTRNYDFDYLLQYDLDNFFKLKIPPKAINACKNILLEEFTEKLKVPFSTNSSNDFFETICNRFKGEINKRLKDKFKWLQSDLDYLVI